MRYLSFLQKNNFKNANQEFNLDNSKSDILCIFECDKLNIVF